MIRLLGYLVSISAFASGLTTCGGSDLLLPSETAPADLALIEGNNQTGVAGQPLTDSLVVKVTDRKGDPAVGHQVTFTLVTDAPGAVVSPDLARTRSDGTARARWTLGNITGIQTVVARVVGLDGIEVDFDATAGPASAARIEAVSGDGQTAAAGAALNDSLVVQVLDQFGNPVAGVAVQWEADRGSVAPSSVTTGADGRAATFRILGHSTGTQTATASSSGLDGSPVSFSSTAVAGSANELIPVSGDDQTGSPGAQLPKPLVVRLVDSDGNGVSGRVVNWLIGAGKGSVEFPTSTTDGDGKATLRWTLGDAGTNTLNAVVSGVGVVTFTAMATNGGGSGGGGGGSAHASRLAFQVQPSDSKEKKKIEPPVEVVVLDQNGNRFTARAIEIKLELRGDGKGKLQGDPTRQTESGVATFDDLRVDKEGNYWLHASADGLPSVDSDRFEVHKGQD